MSASQPGTNSVADWVAAVAFGADGSIEADRPIHAARYRATGCETSHRERGVPIDRLECEGVPWPLNVPLTFALHFFSPS